MQHATPYPTAILNLFYLRQNQSKNSEHGLLRIIQEVTTIHYDVVEEAVPEKNFTISCDQAVSAPSLVRGERIKFFKHFDVKRDSRTSNEGLSA
ncbi:unnamed protein product [Acanthoscelides obtectus]|uniref:Uncharacterized protein n=1 Tax=Acanthoscelides obtectus TaxID=200917 RepID=A0A9P0LMH8_ACAOB|nr:unnamed protein product [Acanthoscelides obtectus]CAK1670317.1 hypothetical protein AOBTE_LOCUS27556 [Acanthoscelides obtectus]